jgi:hypothetical protein
MVGARVLLLSLPLPVQFWVEITLLVMYCFLLLQVGAIPTVLCLSEEARQTHFLDTFPSSAVRRLSFFLV